MPRYSSRSRRRGWTATDRGMLHLVKLVVAPDWSADEAAARLADQVRDPEVLEQMWRRVRAALESRPSEFDLRADRTLSAALARSRAA